MIGCLPALALLLTVASCPAEDEIYLTSGDHFVDTVLSVNDDQLTVQRRIWIKRKVVTSVITYPTDLISHRSVVPPLAEQYRHRAQGAADTVAGQCALALWCLDNCLIPEGVRHAKRADDLDPGNGAAAHLLKELGQVQDPASGDWVDADAYLARTGLVEYQGQMVTQAEADQRRATAKATYQRQDLLAQIDADQQLLLHGDERIADAQKALAELKASLASATGTAASATARAAAIQARLNRSNGSGNSGSNGSGGSRRQSQADQEAADLADAQSAASTAQEQVSELTPRVARAQAQLTSLTARVAAAKTDLPSLQTQLAAIEQQLGLTKPAAAGTTPVPAAPASTGPGHAAAPPAAGPAASPPGKP